MNPSARQQSINRANLHLLSFSVVMGELGQNSFFALFREAANENDTNLALRVIDSFNLSLAKLHNGCSVLNLACSEGNVKFVRTLLDRGASDVTDDNGHNAVTMCVISRQHENLKFLLSQQFSVVSNTGKNALNVAIEFYNQPAALLLLESGMPVMDVYHPMLLIRHKFVEAGFDQKTENQEFDAPTKVTSLRQMARNSIRRSLKTDKNMIHNIKLLPLPKVLKKFVLESTD